MIGLQNTGVDSCGGHLTIGSTLMHCPAWLLPDVRVLWLEAAQRGGDLIIPGAAGVLPRKRRRTVTEYPLRLLVSGDVQPDGDVVAAGDRMAQLELNLDALQAAIVAPTGVGNGTRAASLLKPSGAVVTADVHVQGISIRNEGPRHLECVLELSVPAGRFS